MAFLEETKPISTCKASNCNSCPTADSVHCHFSKKELLHFYLISFPAFLLGGWGIFSIGWVPLVVWIGIIILYFNFIEIRVMCSHCPHYAEEGKTLSCWANHGSPKLWKYRPGPMSFIEKTVFLAGFAVVWGYPLVFLVMSELWFMLGIYVLLATGFFTTLKMFLCSQCMNFACPLNHVPESKRELFFRRNPVVAKAWGYIKKEREQS